MSSQTSRKSGVASTSEKARSANHHQPFDPMPQTRPVGGAIGREGGRPVDGSASQPEQERSALDDLEDAIDP